MKQFALISYDISDDKRRTRVMKTLKNYGARVQYSVFECILEERQLADLKRRLKPLVGKYDSVRFYFINQGDLARIQVLGSGSVTADRSFFLH